MTGPYHWFSDHAFSHRGAVAAHSVLPRPFRHHGLQHAKLPCPSLSSWACSNLFPLSWWCHPTISFSVAPFSSCSQSFSVSGSFPMRLLFESWARVLEFQLLHQSFQWVFRVDFLWDWLFDLIAVQGTLKSSPAPQFESINSSVLSLHYGPTLTSWLLGKP